MTFQLLSTANPKTLKGEGLGYVTYILHLSPSTVSGYNTCPKATPGCAAACLNTAGRGGMFTAAQGTNVIQEARKRKTRWFYEDRESFLAALRSDIEKAIKQAAKHNKTPVFRLNGTSDITWEKHDVIQRFPGVQFYDYTKILGRKNIPANYHLTFSRAESNDADVAKALAQGMNVAAVYDRIPEGMWSADETDLRFLDPQVGLIGLKAKGKARKDQSGFVIRLTTA